MLSETDPKGGSAAYPSPSDEKGVPMGYFHSNGGLCFERLENGGVEVTRRLWGWADPHSPDKEAGDVIDHRWRMTAAEWASVVASMSAKGETSESWNEALRFHDNTAEADLEPRA